MTDHHVQVEKNVRPRLLRIEQAAAYLGLSPKTISNRLSDGTFPVKSKRIGRTVLFDLRDLDKYVDELPHV